MKSDEALVQEALKDPEVFGELISRYEAKLDRYIRRLGVKNDEDREDVLQDIFIKAYRYLNSFDQSLSFSSWIYRIAHNEAISWYRKRRVRPEGHLVDDSEELLSFIDSGGQNPEQYASVAFDVEQVSKALEALDQRYRDVLVLRFIEHKEYEEISDILKVPIGSVGTWIHRGKVQLREMLQAEGFRQ